MCFPFFLYFVQAFCPQFNYWCSSHWKFEKAHRVTIFLLHWSICFQCRINFSIAMIYGAFGSFVVNPCRAYLDCHLMVTNPIDYVEPLGRAGASGFTFHVEASKGWYYTSLFWLFFLVCCFLLPTFIYYFLFCLLKSVFLWTDNWKELVQRIKLQGMRPGVALKPGTPVGEVYPLVSSPTPCGRFFFLLFLLLPYLYSWGLLSSLTFWLRVSWVFVHKFQNRYTISGSLWDRILRRLFLFLFWC